MIRWRCHDRFGLMPPGAPAGGISVVIDVLRASTTMVTALAQGASRIVPVADADAVRRLAVTSGWVHLVCAGTDGAVSAEDELAAGAILDAASADSHGDELDETAREALAFFRRVAAHDDVPARAASREGDEGTHVTQILGDRPRVANTRCLKRVQYKPNAVRRGATRHQARRSARGECPRPYGRSA